MPTYRDEAIVLRTHKLGEADRIVTLLTRLHGKVRAVARGVRRVSSKFGGRLEPCSHVDLEIASGRTLDTITQAVTLHPFSEPMRADYRLFTTAQVMTETADRVVGEDHQPALRQHLLLVGALRTLTTGTPDGPRPAGMIMDSYLLRAVALAGYGASLDTCAACGAPGPHEAFSATAGGAVCRQCRPPGSAVPRSRTMPYLLALRDGDWVSTRAVPDIVQRQASDLVASFVGWQLDHRLRSLVHVER
ncbi:DNA repair protein RecO [Propionicicella superfundia]|uniref:DNA repair protein RecO n=1 Tax=Propionicicella superfundia TaxID=348582 RepID=UPI0003FA0DB1|nr:DNA repair protein RecO [Propionicicella superfundia]